AEVSLHILFFYFFFQAEDGIRDRNVTGVQTCALPISAAVLLGARAAHDRLLDLLHAPDAERRQQSAVVRQEQGEALVELAEEGRSEERRVGKEWRGRWEPYQ